MEVKEAYELYIYNLETVKRCFSFEDNRLLALAAINAKEKLDEEKIKQCISIIDRNTSFFSNFRGITKIELAIHLSKQTNPEEDFKKIIQVYQLLKTHFTASSFLVNAASIIYNYTTLDNMEEHILKAKNIYQAMKKQHPFITGAEDHVFSILLSFLDKQEETIIEEMEDLYLKIKPHTSSNVAQMLSQIFVFSNTPIQSINDMFDLKEELEKQGLKYGIYHECASLAFLDRKAIDDILEANRLLMQYPKYKGIFGFDKKTRAMHATLLVSSSNKNSELTNISSITQTMIQIINEQIMLCTMIATMSAINAS